MKLSMIGCVDEGWAIGYKGNLLTTISDDLRRFKQITSGNVIIYGHKTLSTFPNGKPLSNRLNIIISRDNKLRIPGCIICNTKEQLFNLLNNLPGYDVAYVIGGQSIYNMLYKYCSDAYLTEIQYCFKNTDKYFPKIYKESNWKRVESSEDMTDVITEVVDLKTVIVGPKTIYKTTTANYNFAYYINEDVKEME